MSQTIYIETTIPSSYHDDRPEPEMAARQHWTRQWWDDHRDQHSLFTSVAVLDELRRGMHPGQDKKLSLVQDLPLLEITREVAEIAEVYIQRVVMPSDPAGDALHLALATFYKIDVLLTWNCEHLANQNKLTHIRRTNALMGLWTPDIVTPLNLFGGVKRMKQDPLVDEVRLARREISRECGHDIWKLYMLYEAVQDEMKKEGKRRFISQPPVGRAQEVSGVRS